MSRLKIQTTAFTQYDRIWDFEAGFAEVELNGKKGFIDREGKEVIPCKYDKG